MSVNGPHHTATLLQAIARDVRVITPATTVNQTIELFQQNSSLLALPVMEAGGLCGIISRRELFYSHLARPFARELFGRKSVNTLLGTDPLVLPGTMDISSALRQLMLCDPQLENDCFGVSLTDGTVAIAVVADLMMAISRSQADLLETLERLSSRIRNEVEMARQVQTALLPATPLHHAGVSVAAGLVNSTEISGDFYDVFPLDEHRLGLLVADVTGHGVQAGLVTTAAKAGLQILLKHESLTPAKILGGINRAILATTQGKLLMTALAAIIDRHNNTLTVSSAGHPYPYYWSKTDGECHMINMEPGFPLGFDESAEYHETTRAFTPGDRLLLFSDGIQEAENSHGEAFGERQLQDTLRREAGSTPVALRDALLADARRFCDQEHFEDDVTLVVAMREA